MELISGEKPAPGSPQGHDRALSSTLASVESLSMPPMQEVVLSADIGCVECRKRIAEVMSRMNEVESMTVSVREKVVTLSCRYPYPDQVPARKPQLLAIYQKSFNKVALIKKIIQGRGRGH